MCGNPQMAPLPKRSLAEVAFLIGQAWLDLAATDARGQR